MVSEFKNRLRFSCFHLCVLLYQQIELKFTFVKGPRAVVCYET